MGKMGILLGLLGAAAGVWGEPVLHLKITGVEGPPNYYRELMGQALKAQGYRVEFELQGNLTGTRMEAELLAGMGVGWAEMEIWKANNLPAVGVDGDRKVLYKMVLGPALYPNLEVEKNLLLVYDKDQILSVSPKNPELKPILEKALAEASRSGLIKKLVSQFSRQVFEPPLDRERRTVITLQLP